MQTEIHFITQVYGATQELSMQCQCELVCFPGGYFASPVKLIVHANTGHQLGGWDLELLSLLARCLLGLVVWYKCLVGDSLISGITKIQDNHQNCKPHSLLGS